MIYDFALLVWALVQIPLRILRGRGGDLSLKARLGLIDLPEGPVVLFHGVSVGEIKLLGTIYPKFKGETCVVTTSTKSGLEEAARSLPGAFACLLPFDLSFVQRRFMRRLQPKLLILSEGDLWPNHLKYAKRAGAFIACINAKFSKRSAKRSQLVRRWLIDPIDLVCAQSGEYAERFRSLGATNIHVTGNIKFDRPLQRLPSALKKRLGLAGKRAITLGSTHPGEEELLLTRLLPLLEKDPKLHILLAPRHKERADQVAEFLRRLPLSSGRYSELNGELPRILLIDVLGLLQDLYRLSDISVVAGSFTGEVGGHNLFEPLQAKSALIYGPHIYSQRQMHDLVQGAKAGLQLNSSELAGAIESLLANVKEREELAKRGETLAKASQGALKKTLNALQGELDG